jgi:hypothetical protein
LPRPARPETRVPELEALDGGSRVAIAGSGATRGPRSWDAAGGGGVRKAWRRSGGLFVAEVGGEPTPASRSTSVGKKVAGARLADAVWIEHSKRDADRDHEHVSTRFQNAATATTARERSATSRS